MTSYVLVRYRYSLKNKSLCCCKNRDFGFNF